MDNTTVASTTETDASAFFIEGDVKLVVEQAMDSVDKKEGDAERWCREKRGCDEALGQKPQVTSQADLVILGFLTCCGMWLVKIYLRPRAEKHDQAVELDQTRLRRSTEHPRKTRVALVYCARSRAPRGGMMIRLHIPRKRTDIVRYRWYYYNVVITAVDQRSE